ncbi:hypothetical protein ACWEQL_09395 [Kitasatospora sp. NPDC004240]
MNATVDAGPIVVHIDGVSPPTHHQHLPEALATLWRTLRTLPLTPDQAAAFRYFLTRPNAAEHVRSLLDRDGGLHLTVHLGDRLHCVSVSAHPR